MKLEKQFQLLQLQNEARACDNVGVLQEMICKMLEHQFTKDELVTKLLVQTLPDLRIES